MRKVVITGLGVVSPLGCGVETFWQRICTGANGIRAVTRFDTEGYACRIAGEVPSIAEDPIGGFDVDQVLAPRDQRRMDRFIHFAIAAADEALRQSGFTPKTEFEKTRSGTMIATGVGGFPAMTAAAELVAEKGPRRVSPFLVPSFLANLASGQVSIRHGLKGPIGAPVTACAASLQAIGDAARLIRCDEADLMVAGGAEACIDPVSFAGFSAAKAMSTRNDDPAGASRPFDQRRDGFVMGEGAGVLVLESEKHALARGATPLAVVSGYGTAADAYHVTAGSPDGDGGIRAMQGALASAGLQNTDIGYVNAHSTSTPVGDAAEIAALNSIFSGRGKDLAVSSSKSMFGHLLGAAGAVEAICCVQALLSGMLPPSRNLQTPDPALPDFEFVPGQALARDVTHILSNGFGFGGVNTSAVFSRA
ncbi:beta-ketoacyl-ACP synthase II [Roseibium sp. CAU 1637]|uniref:3-oxoacyl-[acyl-carrier-protein] synthase 2 n=1 Tax=Roseibium limicola TaxID=2816037 RepID=A0A939ENN5_9HYPH|nr:beta-ketoacyl-ACP synthase II [Roseibium limicola]MBO0345151.1 beta-ketoacyl-ACP synthase II [Roseibium limicola]